MAKRPPQAPERASRRRRLPPLSALRAFEAAARHLSVLRAADELCVTPAAVSHQLRVLEDDLGQPLFRRVGRALALTEAGEVCFPGIREGFEHMEAAIAELERLGAGAVLTVSVAPSLAAKWLVPRLDRFQARHPGIDVRVDVSAQLANFAGDGVDVAIRYGGGRYPGLHVERLMPESVAPVAAPALRAAAPIAAPADLAGVTLLHDDSPDLDPSCPSWPMWLRAAGVADRVDGNRGPRFTQSSLVLEAAARGKGVALAKATLAAADLAAGRLEPLFGPGRPIDFAYWIVAPRRKLALPKVAAFAAWLRDEARADATPPAG